MAYMNRWLRNLVGEMERTFTLPANWNNYIYQVEQNHNIIIKSPGDMCYCTNCQQTFSSKVKIKTEIKCPHCKRKLAVRSNRLKRLEYKDNVIMLDKVKDQLIVRIFEMRSCYNSQKQEFNHSTVEYSRKLVYEDYRELRNERIQPGVTSYCVNHYMNSDGEWRLYSGYWYETVMSGYLYKDNLKEVLKNTIYEKSRLWDCIRRPTEEYYNIKDLLYEAKQPSFETLVELKLYNLAMEANAFWHIGSFYKIFGVSKDYYEFMKKHNITKEQLEILKIYPTKNIRKIKFLEKYQYVIKEIKEYTSLDNFINYFRKKRLKDAHLYRDYLRLAKELGYDLKNKRYLFPDKLKTMHDKYSKQVEVIRQEKLTKGIEKRVQALMNNVFKNKEFIIFPARSVDELIDESNQQNNCVKTYAQNYADGNCDIYFMRFLKSKNKSLVTIEVRNNKVVQKRTKNNGNTTKKQDKFLNDWQKKVLNKIAV